MAALASSGPSFGPSNDAQPPTNRPSTHPYTCNTCQVAFRNGDLQRAHMHSDWHRYNLQRRVASLPPIASEVFAEKVVTAQASSTAAAARASFEKTCEVCQRSYYSENAFQNHMGSQKHKTRLVAAQTGPVAVAAIGSVADSPGSPGPAISVVSEPANSEVVAEFSDVVQGLKDVVVDEADPVSRRPTRPHHSADVEQERAPHPLSPAVTMRTHPALPAGSTADPAHVAALSSCLFCNYQSPSLALNVHHMGRMHGMFIPEQAYLTDPAGLIEYLRGKVFERHECLGCGKSKGTSSGVQTHMRDKGHCMIAFDSEEQLIEIGEFYDFSSTYSDADDDDDASRDADTDMVPGGGVSLTERAPTATKDPDLGAGAGDGWETDSSASSLDSADLTAVPLDHRHQYERLDKHPHHSRHDPRPHRHVDGWHSHAHLHSHPHAVYYDDYELHLPSGRAAGHRSLARYFRQNLHHRPQSTGGAPPALTDGDAGDAQAAARGRQLTMPRRDEMGLVGVGDARRREIKAVETRARKQELRQQLRMQWTVNKTGNQQKHFRDPLLQ
ncbi:MAG: hypothetical protein M1826_004657 [Phylliscum demangeonii]|nr:MAG: hypothetical protein M1826_004657 [Phylliscum demangeonii]